ASVEVWACRLPDQAPVLSPAVEPLDRGRREGEGAAEPHDAPLHEAGRLVSGGEDDPPGPHPGAVGGVQLDAPAAREVLDHLRAVVHFQPSSHRSAQQPVGEAIRIDLPGRGREQRHRAGEREALADVAPGEELDLDPGGAPGDPLALEHRAVAAPAAEIEAAGGPPAAAVSIRAGQRLDPMDRLEAELVASLGVAPAHLRDEVAQVGVDLILDERGGGRGAAVPDLARLEDGGVNPLPGEPMGHEGAGDSPADDGEVAAEVAAEARVDGGEAVAEQPEGGAAGEVHWGGTYRAGQGA